MLSTIVMLVMIVWMLRMVFHFGASAIPLMLVTSLTALLLRLIVRRAYLV